MQRKKNVVRIIILKGGLKTKRRVENMATISFKENLVVSDSKKAEEIANALKQPRDKTVKSVQPEKLPNGAGSIWFKRYGK